MWCNSANVSMHIQDVQKDWNQTMCYSGQIDEESSYKLMTKYASLKILTLIRYKIYLKIPQEKIKSSLSRICTTYTILYDKL